MKLCAKCKTNERFSEKNSYCRPCKNAGDLKSKNLTYLITEISARAGER